MEDTSRNNSNSSGVPSPEVNGELYALGAMSPQERQEFEARLAAGEVDPEEISEHLLVVTEIAEELASVMPAPRRAVKDALMAAIAPDDDHSTEHPSENSPAAKEQIVVFAHEGEWQEMIPGITIKILFHDAEHSRTTLLVRLEPGAAYPSHRHRGIEECLVLEGDLHVDGTVLRKGDFTVSVDEKVHLDTHSEEGCVLLISSPMNDEFLGHT